MEMESHAILFDEHASLHQPETLLDPKLILLHDLMYLELLLEIDALDDKFGAIWKPLAQNVEGEMESLPAGRNVVVDFRLARLIDHTFIEQITHFKHEYENAGGKMDFIGMEHLQPVSGHALSARKARSS